MTSDVEQQWTDATGTHSVRPEMPLQLVGRDAPLHRLVQGLHRLPLAVIYGLAGVGKSTFAVEAVRRWGGRVVFANARSGSLAHVLDDVRRRLSESPADALDSLAARLSDLGRSLNRSGGLLLLDDIHLLEPEDQHQLVATFGRRLRKGRALLVSRQRIDVDPAGPDRLEVTLEPLVAADARTLWEELDGLYGAVTGFEEAFARFGGNPFALRRAHRGGTLEQADVSPIDTAVATLTPDERFVGLALALARVPLHISTVTALLPDRRAVDALRSLRLSLVVDVDGAAQCTMLDLFREALLASADGELQKQAHAALAPAVHKTSLDPVVRCREEVHHWRSCNRPEEVARILEAWAPILVRAGASAELLLGLQSLPRALRTGGLTAIEGHCLTRLGRPDAAYRLLAKVDLATGKARVSTLLALAQAALLTARLEDCERCLGRLSKESELSAADGSRADRIRATLWSVTGRWDELWALLDQLELRATSDLERSRVLYLRTFAHWMGNQVADADHALQQARALAGDTASHPAVWRMYVTFAALDAALGRLDLAEAVLRETSGDLLDDAEASPLAYPVERAVLLSEQGHRAAAASLLREAVTEYNRSGLHLAELWAKLVLGRSLLLLGRLREGRALLHDVMAEATRVGATPISESARRDLRWDPLPTPEALASEAPALKPPLGSHAHRRACVCLRHLRAQRWAEADAELALLEPLVSPLPGTGYDRSLVEVAHGVLAHQRGDEALCAAALERARAAATQDDSDDDFVDAALRWVRSEQLASAAQSSSRGAQQVLSNAVVLHTRQHRLIVDQRTVSLARRHVLRKLLFTLAQHEDQVVDKETIVAAVWEVEYHPLRHDNALRVNVRRLRVLLEDTPLTIATEETGYRLVCPRSILWLPERS